MVLPPICYTPIWSCDLLPVFVYFASVWVDFVLLPALILSVNMYLTPFAFSAFYYHKFVTNVNLSNLRTFVLHLVIYDYTW